MSDTTIITKIAYFTAPFSISTEDLEDNIVSYINKGNNVFIESPGNSLGLINYYPKLSSIEAEEEANVEATAINIWESEFKSQLVEFQQHESPSEIFCSSVPPNILVVGSLKTHSRLGDMDM